jgi:tyrosine-protein kinase
MNERTENPGANPTDLRAYARVVWRWKFLVLAILVVIPVAAYLYERSRPKVYRATALVEINGGSQLGVASLFNQAPSGPDTTDLLADARLITTTGLAEQAAKFLSPPPANPASLLGSVSATGDQNTGFMTISATASDPHRAADIANAFAQGLVANQTQAAVSEVARSITDLQQQLRILPRHDPTRGQLADQIARFRALRAAQSAAVQIVQAARVPSTAISPRVTRSVILAIVVALLLAITAVAIVEATDRRVRHPDEVGDAAGLPLLSAIPSIAFSQPKSPRAAEAFITLRSSLTYFNVDRRLSSVLITSPGKEDGKTTVSAQLAQALARSGKDVIVIDADLRRPAIAKRLGIPPREGGLTSVLTGQMSLDDALLMQEGSNGSRRGSLRVLPAGSPPPNPSELLGSRRMVELLSDLAERCEMLIIDSTPLLTVSDSMPIIPVVSGVLLVARVNRSSREAVARLRYVVDSAGGHPIGVVATGAKGGGLYVAAGYGYESAYVGGESLNGSSGLRTKIFRRGARREPEQVGTRDAE